MTEVLTAAQMRAIEQAAIAAGQVTGLALMERAGQGVVQAIFEEWPELAAGVHRAVVLCGPGNNGGDGFVVARLLKVAGWTVEVFLYGDAGKLPPDARVNYARWAGMGAVRDDRDGAPTDDGPDDGPDVLVDALFGIGMTRPMTAPGPLGTAVAAGTRVVSVDVPTGLDADRGCTMAPRVAADLTVTFHRAKIGHYLGEGPIVSGRLRVADIGLGAPEVPDAVRLVTAPTGPLGKAPGAGSRRSGHKFDHGHALILGGPSGRGGAARLAARGALRVGAGLVTLGCASGAIAENAARLDAVMLRPVDGRADLDRLLADRRINAICIGPGAGTDKGDLVAAALAWHLADTPDLPLMDADAPQGHDGSARHGHRSACVLDADALTMLAQVPGLFGMLHGGCVLTPHAGEFARLFADLAGRMAPVVGADLSKVAAVRAAAMRAGCVVLLKGADTVIADPTGRCSIHAAAYGRAAPWLATAGSGDVLAGIIAGLLARGFHPFDAACTGAWLHVECARQFGPGLIAEDLPEALPAVFRGLGI